MCTSTRTLFAGQNRSKMIVISATLNIMPNVFTEKNMAGVFSPDPQIFLGRFPLKNRGFLFLNHEKSSYNFIGMFLLIWNCLELYGIIWNVIFVTKIV